MTQTQRWMTIFLISLGLILTRFIIFWIFPPSKKPPAFIKYLGTVLPSAAIALILVYSLKDVQFTNSPFGIPEAIGILAVVFLQKAYRNTLASVFGGTVIYMILIQTVF